MTRDWRRSRHVLGQDRELVAAEAREHVAVADQRLDPPGDGDQQRVAGGVAVACR